MIETTTVVGARRDVARRAGVTVALVAAYWVMGWVRLPFLVPPRPTALWDELALGASLSIRQLGLAPFLIAFLLVELWAHGRPLLRRRRSGPAEEQAGLVRSSWLLALAIASTQAWWFVAALWVETARAMDHGYAEYSPLLAGGLPEAAVMGVTIVAGAALVGVLAHGIDRHGLGSGFAVLAVASLATEIPYALQGVASRLGGEGPSAGASIVLFLFFPAALVGLLRAYSGRTPRVPLPTTGLLPLGLLSLPLVAASVFRWGAPGSDAVIELLFRAAPAMPEPAPGTRLDWHTGFVIASAMVALGWVLARLSHPRRVVVAAWEAAGLADPPAPAAIRTELLRSDLLSLAFLGALAALPFLMPLASHELLLALAVFAAVLLDLASEARARLRHGPLVPAYPLHRVHAVEPALAALGQAGIPAQARARSFRVLFHFFAPFAPVEILVPAARADEAAAICARIARPPETHDAPAAPRLESVPP